MTEAAYYESVEVAGVANEEALETILTSTEEEPLMIEGIAFIETTAVENNDAVLKMYIERECIVTARIAQNLRSHDSDIRLNFQPFYPLNHDLPVGQSFKVGQISGAVLSNVYFTVRYHIRK